MRYQITHSCGHTDTHNIIGSNSRGQRDYQVRNKESQLCSECWKEQQAAQTAAKSIELPVLTGTEKQIAWALSLRLEKYAELDKFLAEARERGDQAVAAGKMTVDACSTNMVKIQKAAKLIKSNTEAKYWIDNRYSDVQSLMLVAIKQV